MNKSIRQFAPPLVTLVMLVFIFGFADLQIATKGVADFQSRSRKAIDAMPTRVGIWEGKKFKIDDRALELLRPNAESAMLYTANVGGKKVEVYYSVIQVKDSRFMTGHVPSNCYPNAGFDILQIRDKVWKLGDVDVNGAEYWMQRPIENKARPTETLMQKWRVSSFFIFPDGKFGSTREELDKAAADYRKLAYGVVQVQVITFDPDLTDKQRDEIFKTLVGSTESLEMIRTLRAGIPK